MHLKKSKNFIHIQMRIGVYLVIKDKVVHQRHVKDATNADDGWNEAAAPLKGEKNTSDDELLLSTEAIHSLTQRHDQTFHVTMGSTVCVSVGLIFCYRGLIVYTDNTVQVSTFWPFTEKPQQGVPV